MKLFETCSENDKKCIVRIDKYIEIEDSSWEDLLLTIY